MGDMMWLALYAAFGLVALWLLWEVLMQYKARLRWRALAFFGFLGVVAGVLLPSVYVITLGVLVFALGQIKVTLSYRRGFSTGWAIGGGPGHSPRRREYEEDHGSDYGPGYSPGYGEGYDDAPYAAQESYPAPPAPAGSPYDELGGYPGGPPPQQPQMQPQEQTAQFSAFGSDQSYAAPYDPGSYAPTAGFDSGSYATTGAYDSADYAQTAGYDSGTYAVNGNGYGQDQQIYADTSGYATDHGYAGYAEPYTDAYSGTSYATPSYYDTQGAGAAYDTGSHGATAGYDHQQYDQYAGSYDAGGYPAQSGYTPEGYAAPADGVWMPQQREADPLGGQAQEQYPQQGYPGYEEQYRY